MKRMKNRRPLRWSMVSMLAFGWFLPLLVLILMMVFLVSGRISRQMEHTVITSMDKAVEICTLRMEDCVTASKNASYMPTIRESYLEYQRTGDQQRLSNEVTLFLQLQYKYNTNFCAAFLCFTEDSSEVYYTYRNGSQATYENVKAFKDHAMGDVLAKAADIDTATVLMNIGKRIYLVRNLVDSSFEPYAVLVLELNKESIFTSMESVWGYQGMEVYWNGVNMAASGAAIEESDVQDMQNALSLGNQKESRMLHQSTWYMTNPSVGKKVKDGQNETIYLVQLDKNEIMTEIWAVCYIFLVLLLFMIPMIFLIFHFFHKKITQPLKVLVDASRQIEDGNYGIEITEIADSEEFYYTDGVFNAMSKQLKNQFEKIYLEEIALRDAKIMALQSQINPHFLNNTLEIINWEARLNGNVKVSGMIEALSTMLEATMNRKKHAMISLSEELSYVDAYLYIIGQRFGEKFSFEKQVDEKLCKVKVPRLIIQPIIENAVEHGMDIRKKGKVRLYVHAEGEKLFIDVWDNGLLTEKEKEKIDRLLNSEPDPEKERQVSLGIRNVDQRLKIIYGADCGLFISSDEEQHTVSRLILHQDEQ